MRSLFSALVLILITCIWLSISIKCNDLIKFPLVTAGGGQGPCDTLGPVLVIISIFCLEIPLVSLGQGPCDTLGPVLVIISILSRWWSSFVITPLNPTIITLSPVWGRVSPTQLDRCVSFQSLSVDLCLNGGGCKMLGDLVTLIVCEEYCCILEPFAAGAHLL